MPTELSIPLRQTIDRELPNLLALTALAAPKPGSWSRREELGHLIDSATNNHIRFVLASIDGEFSGQGYAQDRWAEAHGYRDMEWRGVAWWTSGITTMRSSLTSWRESRPSGWTIRA